MVAKTWRQAKQASDAATHVLGETNVEFPNPSGATVHILTADNPEGQVQSDEANRAAYNVLLSQRPQTRTWLGNT